MKDSSPWQLELRCFAVIAIAIASAGCAAQRSSSGMTPPSAGDMPPADMTVSAASDMIVPSPFDMTQPTSGAITVSGNRLLRDGVPWVPHGLNMIAFVAPPAAQMGVFKAAYGHFDKSELSALKDWGADTIRFQVSQPGTDAQSALYSQAFVDQVRGAVHDARSLGLNVIVSIQDEQQSGETTPTPLPNDATLRVWNELAPSFNSDTGILYEILNEPQPKVTTENWATWRDAMNAAISSIRATGSKNVVIADGLIFALSLKGAPALTDSAGQVAYGIHPYFHSAADQTQTVWDNKFGAFSATAPVIATEWTTVANSATSGSTYFCDSTTPMAALNLLQYLASKNIGLAAFAYDFSGDLFGSAVYGFPGVSSSFAASAQCGSAGYGPGKLIQTWYRTGTVPTALQ